MTAAENKRKSAYNVEYSILDHINNREDLLRLTPEQDSRLCAEIRQKLVETVSQTGGHLASNLGVVELTVAIHKVYDTARDRLVFDVGHQSYVHKLLTGRREEFDTLRQFEGLSGFPKPRESIHDAAIAGHASTAVSLALGMARARTLEAEQFQVVALLGDGALTGGLSYEGLNDAGESGEPLVVILNDNGMSIAPNVGGIARHLANIRLKPGYYTIKRAYRRFTAKVPGGRALYRFTHRLKKHVRRMLLGSTMFEEMGFTYLGPVDGHDLKQLVEILQVARDMAEPVLVHVRTIKGKGYQFAEQNPDLFHGVSGFDVTTGQVRDANSIDFSTAFGRALEELAGADSRICAVTAAMPAGTGLTDFEKRFPKRFFDVGIAEEHAACLAAGLADGGMLPVFAVYSTFLQRAYDMLIQDIAMSGAHVVLAVDRAGLVGADGETHNGVFDVGFLRQIPGVTILCPAAISEVPVLLRQAVYQTQGLAVLRYPKGGSRLELPEGLVLREGGDVTLLGYGALLEPLLEAAELLARQGVQAQVLRLTQIQPLELTQVRDAYRRSGLLLVAEDCVDNGSVGQAIAAELAGMPGKILRANHGEQFVEQGSTQQLWRKLGLDAQGLADRILAARQERGV